MYGSAFLTELNRPHRDRGEVDYYLFCGDKDNVINLDSGEALGVPVASFTDGAVGRELLSGADHGSIYRNEGQIDRVAELIRSHVRDGLEITGNPAQVDAESSGWYYSITVRNTASKAVTLEDLNFSHYGKSGAWFSSQWYDPDTPNGVIFPTTYAIWGKVLSPGASVTLQLHSHTNNNDDPIDSIPPEYQARTQLFSVRGHIGTQQVVKRTRIVCHYGAIWPEEAQTRSRERSTGIPFLETSPR